MSSHLSFADSLPPPLPFSLFLACLRLFLGDGKKMFSHRDHSRVDATHIFPKEGSF